MTAPEVKETSFITPRDTCRCDPCSCCLIDTPAECGQPPHPPHSTPDSGLMPGCQDSCTASVTHRFTKVGTGGTGLVRAKLFLSNEERSPGTQYRTPPFPWPPLQSFLSHSGRHASSALVTGGEGRGVDFRMDP